MRDMRMILGVLMLVLMSANTLFAQDTSNTATVTTGSVVWHDPTQSGRLNEDLRLSGSASWGMISLEKVRNRHYNAQVLSGSASTEFRLSGAEGLGSTGADAFLGAQFDISNADGNGSVLDRRDVSGQITLALYSQSHAENQDLAWEIKLGTGAEFQSWNGDRVLWFSSVKAEVSLNVLDETYHPFGPYLGFDGTLGIGEDQSNQLRGRLAAGLRGTTDGALSEWRLGLTTTGFMDEGNRRKEYLVESDGYMVGFEASITLGGVLTLGVSGDLTLQNHTHEGNREIPGRDVDSHTRGGRIQIGAGLSF